MRKLFKDVLLVLLLALGFVFGSLDVYAETSDTSKWDTNPVEKLTTSDGIDIIPDFTGVKINKKWASIGGTIVLNVVIPENYDKEEVVIAPEVFQRITKLIYEDESIEWLEDDEYLRFMNSFQASDKIRVKLVITNLSKFDYYYEETSFEIFPTEPLVYPERETTTGDGDKTLFNGMELPTEGFIFHRAYNTALKALLPDMDSRSMTDEKIDAALKAKGYTGGINDYGKYLLDFYNTKYNTNYSRLDQFSKGIIREMLSDLDPVYLYNSAYGKLLDMPSYKFPTSEKDAKKKILAALENTEFKNDPIGYLLDYYNKAYNTNAKNLSELCDEAINDLYANAGYEYGGYYNLETNKDVLVLAYNYFYNEGLSFYFDQKDKNGNYTDNKNMSNSDREGENYSIGSYMRDEKKGDEEILERAGTLKSNSENTISGVLKNIGNYTPNAYLNFNFMVNLQLKYRARTGNLIIRYVDREGNELLSSVTNTEIVGKDYQTNPEDILNYELVDIDGVEIGKYIDGTIIVTYIYDKVSSEETGEITPPNTGVIVDGKNNSDLLLITLISVGTIGMGLVLRKSN